VPCNLVLEMSHNTWVSWERSLYPGTRHGFFENSDEYANGVLGAYMQLSPPVCRNFGDFWLAYALVSPLENDSGSERGGSCHNTLNLAWDASVSCIGSNIDT
jgi:hypothetical protein